MPRKPLDASRTTVDMDLGGVVRIRLVDAEPADVTTVRRQLGLPVLPARGTADLVVRFVDSLTLRAPLAYVGWGETGYTGDDFYVLRGTGNVEAKAKIPFADIGLGCELVCERAMPSVPLLLAVVNMTALAKGVLPVHASAFDVEGTSVLAMGWAKGGKTETLLSCLPDGARYIADEWVYLTAEGAMFGVPEPIRLWRWLLRQDPDLMRRVGIRRRCRMALLDALAVATERAAGIRWGPRAVLRRAAPVLRRQVYVQVPPSELFGADRIRARAPLEKVVLVSLHDSPGVDLQRIEGAVAGRRMSASLQYEREPFMACYRQFRFAFPDLPSPVVEAAVVVEQRLLEKIFAECQVWHLAHPYPPLISSIRQAVHTIVSADQPHHPIGTHICEGPS